MLVKEKTELQIWKIEFRSAVYRPINCPSPKKSFACDDSRRQMPRSKPGLNLISMTDFDLLCIVQAHLSRVRLRPGAWMKIAACHPPIADARLRVSLPVHLDDGGLQVFRGFRVQYDDALGPAKGGARFHAAQSPESVTAPTALMTWKRSRAGLDLWQ